MAYATKPMFDDPIGPGTPAWNAFDNALAAWAGARDGERDSRTSRLYHRYSNQRAAMITALRKAGADEETVCAWLADLRARIACRDFD